MKRVGFFISMFTFILGFIVFLNFISNKLIPNIYQSNIDKFINNNYDIIFLGSSVTKRGISPMYIYDKYRIKSYNFSGEAQNIYILYELLKQLDIQNSIIVIDLGVILYNPVFHKNNDIFKIYFDFHNLLNYRKNIIDKNNILFDLFPIYLYHTNWKYISEDINSNTNLYGQILSKSNFQVKKVNQPLKNNNIFYDDKHFMIGINSILNYIEKKQIHVIFWVPPFTSSRQERYSNSFLVKNMLDKINNSYIDYINFNDDRLIGIFDYDNDFGDSIHLNKFGSRKVMDHLIPYIIEHYNIPNHKNDPKYASWNEDYKKYARAINREEIRELKSFNEWKKLAFYDNYTVMMSVNGDILKKMPDTLKNDLKSFGLTKYNTDKPNMRYAAIIDDNKVFFEEISNKPVIYKGRMKNIVNLLIKSDGKSTINVSGKPRSKNKYGLNFVIYDKINREIVDSIWIDPNKPDVVRR